jgi:hypothetical protein
LKTFEFSQNTIQDEAAIDIASSPDFVAAIYRDVEKWGEIFPATIELAKVVQTGENWKEIEVTHKQEGCVPNTLFDLSETEIGLQESKHKFDASFINRFEPAADGGTHYVIRSSISLKGIYKILKPFLIGYVHRQALKRMQEYVLEPMKIAAERSFPGLR